MGTMEPVKPPDKSPTKPQISPPPPPKLRVPRNEIVMVTNPRRRGRRLFVRFLCWALLGSSLWVPASSGSNSKLWPPTGYVLGQPVRNLGRFCGDCQLRQAERVEKRRRLWEAFQAWRELDRRQRELEQQK